MPKRKQTFKYSKVEESSSQKLPKKIKKSKSKSKEKKTESESNKIELENKKKYKKIIYNKESQSHTEKNIEMKGKN